MEKNNNGKLKALDLKLKKIRAGEIMTKKVVTIGQHESIYTAAKLMIKKRISGIPVVSRSGKIQGIITENDLFMVMDMVKSGNVLLRKRSKSVIPEVGFAMSVDFGTVTPDATLDEIIVLMKYQNQHTVPVLEKGELAGIIGKRDVFENFYSAVVSC